MRRIILLITAVVALFATTVQAKDWTPEKERRLAHLRSRDGYKYSSEFRSLKREKKIAEADKKFEEKWGTKEVEKPVVIKSKEPDDIVITYSWESDG